MKNSNNNNQHISTVQAAQKWGISDRRVRKLCDEGKIEGAIKYGSHYKIPKTSTRPSDGRRKKLSAQVLQWLKWDNEVIGMIDSGKAVRFIQPNFNEVVGLYTRGASGWSAEQFSEFLSERVVSRDRRDIEKILFRCGLSHYDVLQIADITRGIHPKDLIWIARSEDERLDGIMTDVFASVFHQKIDMAGDSIDTPEGYNIKRYGVYNGRYGIFKKRISPLMTDAESEVAVYLLAKRLGVPCCPAYMVDKETVFSAFLYDFSKEYIVHFRRLFDGARSDNEYQNLIAVRPQYTDDIARMILLDFITRQDDRHLSNVAIKMSGQGESFYPLYDNGRSLFYEDTEEIVDNAIADPITYATTFGYSGTYYDYIKEIAEERENLNGLLDLAITKDEIAAILTQAGFKGYRYNGALEWITKTIKILQDMTGGQQ